MRAFRQSAARAASVLGTALLLVIAAPSTAGAQTLDEVEPQTVFELRQPTPLSDVVGPIQETGARPLSFKDQGGTTGGYLLGKKTLKRELAIYRELHGKYDSGEPQVIEFTLGGTVPTSALGALSAEVEQRLAIPTDIRASLPNPLSSLSASGSSTSSSDVGNSSTSLGDAPSSSGTASSGDVVAAGKKGDNKAFSPSEGFVDGYNTTNSLPRHMTLELSWASYTALDSFGDRAYEHDFKLANDAAPAKCPDVRRYHWAWRVGNAPKDGVAWRTNFPSDSVPFLDTQLLDDCTRMDFTVGVFHPGALSAGVKYRINIDAGAGRLGSETYGLESQAPPNDCFFDIHSTYCLDPLQNKARDELIGLHEANVPGCLYWYRDADNRACS